MIKAKEATDLQPVYFEWDEKFKVMIGDVPQDVRQKLIKSNEEITFNKKHQKKEETNWLKYGKDFLRLAITGWVGLTYRYLLDICRPITLDPGVKLDDPIEFNQENLAFLAEHYRLEFGAFINESIARLDEIYSEQKKKEIENL
jgi:hypothetical protein